MNQVSNSHSKESLFPQDFLWGAATASHQVEGNTVSDWSEWEKENALFLAQDSANHFGQLPCWSRVEKEATDPQNYISGSSTDHYHRFEEDFDIAKNLHHNVHRFSLEWSRIEPEKGVFDQEALQHYQHVVQALRARDIEPFVTLWHWTLPRWLRDEGGLTAKNFARYFERYARTIAHTFKDDITFITTLNEPDVVTAHGYLLGKWPPQKKSFLAFLIATYHLIHAHKKAYRVLKIHNPKYQIGIAKHQVVFLPDPANAWNKFLKYCADFVWNDLWLIALKNSQDFLGLNHYHSHRIAGWYGKNKNEIVTDFGWEYNPESLKRAILQLKKYHLPIYVTENGVADATDELRQDFIPRTIAAIESALAEGADVRGYMYWSLLDNFEWDKGYWLKFGLIAVDRTTFVRTVRPSAFLYSNLIKEKMISSS